MGSVAVKDCIYYYQDFITDDRGTKCEHEAQWNHFILNFLFLKKKQLGWLSLRGN